MEKNQYVCLHRVLLCFSTSSSKVLCEDWATADIHIHIHVLLFRNIRRNTVVKPQSWCWRSKTLWTIFQLVRKSTITKPPLNLCWDMWTLQNSWLAHLNVIQILGRLENNEKNVKYYVRKTYLKKKEKQLSTFLSPAYEIGRGILKWRCPSVRPSVCPSVLPSPAFSQ